MYNEVFKDLHRRTVSDNVLRDKAFIVVKNPKYYGYQQGHASTCSNFLIKSLWVMLLNLHINLLLKEKL